MLQKFKHTLAASCNIKIFKWIKRCLFSSILKYCSYFQASFEKQNYKVSELSSWLKKKFPIMFLCVFLLYGHLCWNDGCFRHLHCVCRKGSFGLFSIVFSKCSVCYIRLLVSRLFNLLHSEIMHWNTWGNSFYMWENNHLAAYL